MKDSTQLLNEAANRKHQLKRGLMSKTISDVNPQDDTMLFDGSEGLTRPVPVQHAFLSVDSWIRSMPMRGSGCRILQQLAEDQDIVQSYYYPNREKLVEGYRNRDSRGNYSPTNVYRPLYPGEHEISSTGMAQTYWSARGRWQSHGGVIDTWLDQEMLEAGTHAPTHLRKLHRKFEDKIGDEERFGVVKRPVSSTREKYVKIGGKWAKEYLRFLLDGDGKSLIDHREGNVISDSGAEVNSRFGNPLRFSKKIHTSTSGKTVIEIDSKGNTSVTLSENAKDGGYVSIPSGKLKVLVDGELHVKAAGNTLDMKQGSIQLKVGIAGPTLKMDSTGVTVNGHNLVYHEFLDYYGAEHLPSMGIVLPTGFPVMHNPSTIVPFTTKNTVPGLFRSNSPVT